ncbi:L,D-transpeptidase family protein [Prosthecobacter sp.]|uniref:L,D-transpeptidase family protein n=1 Tax=Prosthecobacter sp. TaxID=1965333 RepID=UPI003783636A
MTPQRPSARLRRTLLVLGCAFAGVSCSSSPEVADSPLDSRAWWKGDGVSGKPRIVINLSTQRVQYFKDKELVGVSPVSSGREGHGTVTGSYSILDKDIDHRSSLFGSYVDKAGNVVQSDVDTRTDPAPPGTTYQGANMRYFMRIVGGIGMHEGYLPGYPASHGCIRLPTKMARIFFKETPEGTPVQIVGQSSLAATESAIPIGVEIITDVAAAPKKGKAKVAAAAAPAKVASAAPAKPAKGKPKVTVRRAVVDGSKSSGGFGSMFNWAKRPPRGSTIYLEE